MLTVEAASSSGCRRRRKIHADDQWRGDEGQHERLDNLDDVGGNTGLELHLGGAAVERAEHEGGQHDAEWMCLPEERDSDAVETDGAAEFRGKLMVEAQGLDGAGQPRQAAGDRHGQDDCEIDADSGVRGSFHVVADGPHFEAERRLEDQPPDE